MAPVLGKAPPVVQGACRDKELLARCSRQSSCAASGKIDSGLTRGGTRRGGRLADSDVFLVLYAPRPWGVAAPSVALFFLPAR